MKDCSQTIYKEFKWIFKDYYKIKWPCLLIISWETMKYLMFLVTIDFKEKENIKELKQLMQTEMLKTKLLTGNNNFIDSQKLL